MINKRNSMKVLFTTFSYYPETSGVPVVVQYLAEGLAKKGHNVSVVTCMNGHDYKVQETLNGVTIYRFNWGLTLFKKKYGEYQEYIKFVTEFPKDIIILECLQCHTTDILLPYLKYMNCKVLLHSHGGPGINQKIFRWDTNIIHSIGNTHNWFRWKKYYNSTLPSLSKYIDVVLCLSLCASDLRYMKKYMKRVEILENAANDIFFDKNKQSLDFSSVLNIKAKKYILSIANYIPNKGQIAIVKAFANIKDEDYALVCIGSSKNEYYEKVLKEASFISHKYGKEIHLLTGVSREYFPSIISHASLFVMGSEHEEYPVSLIEAMACRTPFVSTNAGCARILPGGITVMERTELSDFMDAVISNSELSERLRNQGFLYSSRNNRIEEIIKRLECIISTI